MAAQQKAGAPRGKRQRARTAAAGSSAFFYSPSSLMFVASAIATHIRIHNKRAPPLEISLYIKFNSPLLMYQENYEMHE